MTPILTIESAQQQSTDRRREADRARRGGVPARPRRRRLRRLAVTALS